MTKRVISMAAAVLLGLFGMIFATHAQAATPAGCTTSIEWVQQGSDYFQGKGTVTCSTGTYRAKLVCHNMQTGAMYVKYGTQVVTAPNPATAICNTGNVAEKVAAVAEPPGTGVTGCVFWTEWVQQGSDYFQGKGTVSCDTGSYKAKLVCRNMQTGVAYVKYGTLVVTAPGTTTATCNTGNVAEQVTGAAAPPGTGVTGCVSWTEWISTGYNSGYHGRGTVQCDTGSYKVKLVCRNKQTGTAYLVHGAQVATAPGTATTTCYTGNVAEQVAAVANPLGTGVTGCLSWTEWVSTGYNSGYDGRGTVQCDTGSYRVQINCRNLQTGQNYIVNGPSATAPYTATTTCYNGNVAQTVTAVPL